MVLPSFWCCIPNKLSLSRSLPWYTQGGAVHPHRNLPWAHPRQWVTWAVTPWCTPCACGPAAWWAKRRDPDKKQGDPSWVPPQLLNPRPEWCCLGKKWVRCDRRKSDRCAPSLSDFAWGEGGREREREKESKGERQMWGDTNTPEGEDADKAADLRLLY